MKIQKFVKIDLNKSSFAYPIRVVQYDTGVQLVLTLTDFEIPTGTTAIVFFMKPSGRFVYQEDNVVISGNTITVDVHNQAFTEFGKVKYQVELTNGSDIITTFSRTIEVERSLSNSGGDASTTVISAFEGLTSEKIAEIEASTLGFIDSVNRMIENKSEEVLASIPDDYTEMGNKVEYRYNNVANAIKGNLFGPIVHADDVSPVTHKPELLVHGKNLFDISKIEDTATARNNGDGTLTVSANTYYCRLEQTLREVCPQLRAGDVATLSFNTESPHVKYMYFHGLQGTWNVGHHLTLTDAILDSYVTIYGYPDTDPMYGNDLTISNIQIELGTTVTNYEEYINPATIVLTRCGKNLFSYPYSENTLTRAGINYSIANDGRIIVSGTSTGSYLSLLKKDNRELYLHAGTTYTFKCCPAGASLDNFYAYISDGTNTFFDLGQGVTITPTESGYVSATIVVKDGKAVNDLVFKPTIVIGNTPADFEPYNGDKYTPSNDGIVSGVTSLSPNMVLYTDKDNVVVDCKYIKDSNVVINKVINAITALGGSV